jgi:Zn-dependent protease with chaperone function
MSANKAFFVLLLSSVFALVGLGSVFFKTIPLLLSHAVYLCQETFSNVLFSISHSIPLILISLVIMVLLVGFLTLWIQALKTRTYLRKHLEKIISIPFNKIAMIEELGLKDKVSIVKNKGKFSFCYGLIQPKVCLSTGLLRSLSTDELEAVLLHEYYHIENHDPAKIILSKTASIMFFFIPILKDFQNFYALSKEIAADKLVVSNGHRQPLLSVLSKLLVGGSPKFSGVAALASVDDLEKRVLYLTGNQIKTAFRPSLLSISLSALVVLFSLAIVSTPVYAVKDHEGSMEHALFICPFGDKCTLSCKAKEEDVNYSKGLMYTPATYTPK